MTRHMSFRARLAVAALASLAVPFAAFALEVDENALPRIALDAELFATLDYEANPPGTIRDTWGTGTEDSNVSFTLDKHLYDSPLVGGAAVSLRTHEEESRTLVDSRIQGFLRGPRFGVSLGDMRLRNTLVRPPTIRDEDLLTYTHVLNGSLQLEHATDHTFGDGVVYDHFWRPGFWRAAVFSEKRVQTKAQGFISTQRPKPNTLGALIAYDVPGSVRHEHALRKLGLLYDRQEAERRDESIGTIDAFLLGAVLGLNDNPEYPWELGVQLMHTEGLDDRTGAGAAVEPNTPGQLAREAATAAVLSFHYADRTFLRTRWQGALTLAYKTYPELDRGAQWSAVPALFWRISSGLDLVAQVVYTEYERGLADLYVRDRTILVQAGIAMTLDAEFNGDVADYDSILEREFGSAFRGM